MQFNLLINLKHVNRFSKKTLKLYSTRLNKKIKEERWLPKNFELDGVKVTPDNLFNIPSSLSKIFERRLLFETFNPLYLLKQRIIQYFDETYRKPGNRSPIFAILEHESRLVSTFDNFDSLLIPIDHISRSLSDTYYVNSNYCLRAHTSAHQFNLLKQGFDNFIVVGDVYRRDEIDSTHYPCFHQMEGVKTYSEEELFGCDNFSMFAVTQSEKVRNLEKQKMHSDDASKILVIRLKQVLIDLTKAIFGENIEYRWVNAYFPFTHPSFELEIFFKNKWLEVLGCGVIEQKLLDNAGAGSKVGWAFGLGLERIAMALYDIPDIRLFWSRDTGFTHQFKNLKPQDNYKYQPVSVYPQLIMDLSFWISFSTPLTDKTKIQSLLAEMKSNVRDIIRNVGGDLVEQVELIDEFFHEKKQKYAHCYRIVYRSNERPLTKDETNVIHKEIGRQLTENFDVKIR